MELRQRALQALQTPDPQQKVDQASVIWSQFASFSIANSSIPEPPGLPGRPAQPPLIEPTRVPQRSPFTFEGRAALDAYQNHRTHVAVKPFLRAVVSERQCMDYEL